MGGGAMLRRKGCVDVMCLVAVALLAGGRPCRGGARYASSQSYREPVTVETVAMVVPARYRIVQLAFDLARLRRITLFSYQPDPSGGAPVMHVWQPDVRAWVSTSIDAFGSGTAMTQLPAHTVLIGEDAELLAELAQACTWGGEMLQISSLDLVTMVNVLNQSLHFSPREWTWLARRYRLELKDLNAERRRYGRYGKPGKPLLPLRKTPPRLTSPAQPMTQQSLAPGGSPVQRSTGAPETPAEADAEPEPEAEAATGEESTTAADEAGISVDIAPEDK